MSKIFLFLVAGCLLYSRANAQTIDTASNGLTKNSNNIQLGGELYRPTKIVLGSNNMWFKTNFNSSERYDLNDADGHVYIGDSANVPISTIEQNNGPLEYRGRQNAAALIISKTKASNHENVDLFAMTTADVSNRNGWLFLNSSNSIGNVIPRLETYSNAVNGEGYKHVAFSKSSVSYPAYRIILENYDSITSKNFAGYRVKNRTLFSIENGEASYVPGAINLFKIDSLGQWSGDTYKNTDSSKVLTADADGNLKLKSLPVSQWTVSGNDIYSKLSGNVGIGTTDVSDPDFRLFVEKGIRTRKVKVDQTTWPDYVFKKEYKLPSLREIEDYLKQHQHLPGVPSAIEVNKNGIDLGDNQATLLKKVEELTLYLIKQNKKIEEQSKRISALEKALEKSY